MRLLRVPAVVPVVGFLAIAGASAAEPASVHTYTGEELNRMFGPVTAAPVEPVDKSGPEDWVWVEQFLDRQYARIDADREFDLGRRSIDAAAPPVQTVYATPVAWRLGFPVSTWWNTVAARYGVKDLTAFRFGNGGSMSDRDDAHRHDHGRAHGHGFKHQ